MAKYCTNCGKELKEGADICLNCGKLINHDNETKKQEPLPTAKSKIAAGILGILLGCFGVHNFYLGYKNKAILQLVLTIVGFLTIIIAIANIITFFFFIFSSKY